MSREVDWERYGLSSESALEKGPLLASDLYQEEQGVGDVRPWWKSSFLFSEPMLFGVWDGVFTSCMINLFSVIVFLRMGWIVAVAGVVGSVVVVIVTVCLGTVTVLSAAASCGRLRGRLEGGLHGLLSHIVGARAGAAVSLLYCFGQSVSCALHVMGFAESFSQILQITHPYAVRAVGIAMLLLLLGINVAGVQWVIRLQFFLLLVLLLAALDLDVGTLIQQDTERGVSGWQWSLLSNNSLPDWSDEPDEGWFSGALGVFFPVVTGGVLAGLHMSGDLRNPAHDIPRGTLAAFAASFVVYLSFVIGLGATCQRWALHNDYMIGAKVSALGVVFLCGLYVSAVCTCLGALYATPRILQSVAHTLPALRPLAKGRGPNKVPVGGLLVFALVTGSLALIGGSINRLAPLATVPFLLTYACIEYAYFALESSTAPVQRDLDCVFHPPSESPLTSPEEHSSVRSLPSPEPAPPTPAQPVSREVVPEEVEEKRPWYFVLCNKWIALIGALVKVCLMFLVQWMYALAAILILAALWFYIGRANSGYARGVADFRLFPWLKKGLYRCIGFPVEEDEGSGGRSVGFPPHLPPVEVSRLTEESGDYASRKRQHHAQTIHTH